MELSEDMSVEFTPPRISDESDSSNDSADPNDPVLQSGKTFETIMTTVEEYEPFVKFAEDVCALVYQLRRCRSLEEGSVALGVFIRSVTGRATVYFYKDLLVKFSKMFKSSFSLQSDGHWVNTISDFYDNYARCKDSELSRRLKTFFNHLIMHCVYHKLGIEVDSELFDKLEKRKVRPTLINCLSFMDACAGLLIFMLKQGRQVMLTGDIEHFFIDGDVLSKWMLKAKKLKMESEFLCNPAAVNLDVHTFLSELSSAIEESKGLVKYMKVATPEGKLVHGIQFELQAIEKRYLTVTAAQAIRKAPLGLIVYGESGIGKSSVMTVIADFDARRRGRNPDQAFRYTVTAESEYYDNFTSSMHTIIIDDAAIHNPQKIQGVDPTIADIMRINNGIGWCPPQAALEAKGRTPMLANLCMVSTNVHDLNIPRYYRASYAAMRRLKYRIQPVVRAPFVAADGISLDSNKCDDPVGYPDYWSFGISVATRKGDMQGAYEFVTTLPNMSRFLEWLGKVSDAHDVEQIRWLENNSAYTINICPECRNPGDMCLCVSSSLQSSNTFIPTNGTYRTIAGEVVFVASRDQREDTWQAPNPTPGDDNFATFKDRFYARNGNGDLFCEINKADKPWRDRPAECSVTRLYRPELSMTFVEKMRDQDVESMYLDYYAFMELPLLINDGWADGDILHDFYNFSVFVKEHTNVNDWIDISEIFTEKHISIPAGAVVGGIMDAIFKMCVSLYFYSQFFRSSVRYFGKFHFIRKIAFKFLRPCLVRKKNQQLLCSKLGRFIDDSLGGGSAYLKAALAFLSLGTITAIAYRSLGGRNVTMYSEEAEDMTTSVDLDASVMDESVLETEPSDVVESSQIQVLRDFGSFPKSAPNDEKVNMWAVEDRSVTTVDFVPDLCRDLVGFERKLCRNVLVFEVFDGVTIPAWKYTGNLVVLSNEHFVTNSHSLPSNGDCRFIVYLGRNHLVSPKVEFVLKQSQIERILDRDIAVVRTRNLPALFNDISRNFVRASYNGVYDGFYTIKRLDGSVKKIEVLGIKKQHLSRTISGHYFDMEVFKGTCLVSTEVGDCGAPLIALTGYGPVIVGYHVILDSPNTTYAAKFSYEDFKHFACDMKVQVGKVPIGDIEVYKGPKSYIDFHDEGNLMYHGELKVFRCRPKPNVFDSELASQIYGRTLCGIGLERRLRPPVMDSWRAQQAGLKEFLKPVKHMDELLLQRIGDVWVKHILKNLPSNEVDLISPCCLDAAVNGVPGMAYVDSIKRSTSMGFPYYRTKKAFLVDLNDERWPEGVKFTPAVEKRIAEWLETLRGGIRLHAVFGANLKDEAVSFKKFEACKTRIFFSCPVELLVIVRMFYLGFARVVQRNRDLFWVAVGLNTTSPEWDELFHRLACFGIDTTIAGDHVFYDKKVKMLVMYYVMDSINRVCQASGHFDEEMILMMEVLKYELMNPSVDFFGMLITLLGGEVSGHQLTTIFNCILNVFYLMYAFSEAGYDIESFFVDVVGVILGDDHVLCVSPKCPDYHHTQIKDVLEGLGLGYTMADKSSESRPYISLLDAPFLKRNFCYDVALGVYVGRLEFNSIIKMLTIQVRSKSVMASTQLAQAMCSAASEMFFYGEEAFDEFCHFIDSLEKSDTLKLQMLEYPRLSYNGYKNRFWSSTNHKASCTGLQSQKCWFQSSYCIDVHSISQTSVRMDSEIFLARAFPETHFYESMELDTKGNCKVSRVKLTCTLENDRLSKTNEQMNAIQSEIPTTEGSESSNSQQTQFINESTAESLYLGTPHDGTATSLITSSHLSDYLSRPTKIHTFVWTENAPIGDISTMRPWTLFFNNPSIRNKLEGFGYIRCKLHLKFTINASQFYYGSIGAFYTPMIGYIQDTTGAAYGYSPGYQILTSQKPHVWLDPQTTSTAIMELPFLFNRHFLNACSLSEFDDMGELDFTQFAALRSANGVTTAGVNVVTYAWATDVELTGLTSRAVLQSKKEYVGNGQVSGPASTVARVAKRMTSIPVIGPFAKATEMVAGAVGDVASLFGFTNVPNIKDVEPMKPLSFHTLASSEISEPINKLSLQPKQEIAVDSSYAGDPMADQLVISNFCQKESFLCGSLWTTTTPEDSVLFTSHVTPQLYEKSAGANPHVSCVPMAYVSFLFNFWRGDLIFRFKVIKTQFHRGRLSISWDPLESNMANMPGYGNPRVQNIIFDLDETDTVEVRVPYMQQLAMTRLRDGSTTVDGPWWSNGPSPTLTASNGTTNGTIQLRVVNRLTAPEASSDVDVLVFVRAAENIEFASPADIRNKTNMVLQSKTEYCLGDPSHSDPMMYSEIFGEKITSLRELLHRQSKTCTQVIPRNATWSGNFLIVTFPFQRTPRPYGYTTKGSEVASGTVDTGSTFGFNYVRVHPITWLQACFIGTKGSTNWTFNVLNTNGLNTVPVTSIGVCRNFEPSNNKQVTVVIPGTLSTSVLMNDHNCRTGLERQGAQGMALTNQYTQSGVSVNLPYYSRFKFQVNNLPKHYDLSDSTQDEKNRDWFELTVKRGAIPATNDSNLLIDTYVGTGPDFDFVFFLNCPVFTYLPPPTPSNAG
jgi:hypothetical protein